MSKKKHPKAHEVTTVFCNCGVGSKTMGKYMVIAGSTSEALSLVPLKEGEEILNARELAHEVIVKGRK